MTDLLAKFMFHRQRVIELLFRLEDPLDQLLFPLETLIDAKLQVGDFRLGCAQARRQLRLFVLLTPAQRSSSALNAIAILPALARLEDPRENQSTSPSGRVAAILVLGSILVAATGIKASDSASLPGSPGEGSVDRSVRGTAGRGALSPERLARGNTESLDYRLTGALHSGAAAG
jgi:hypothetical protein